MPESRYRVLAIASHPVQYQAPLFRRMAVRPEFDLHVASRVVADAQSHHDREIFHKARTPSAAVGSSRA